MTEVTLTIRRRRGTEKDATLAIMKGREKVKALQFRAIMGPFSRRASLTLSGVKRPIIDHFSKEQDDKNMLVKPRGTYLKKQLVLPGRLL